MRTLDDDYTGIGIDADQAARSLRQPEVIVGEMRRLLDAWPHPRCERSEAIHCAGLPRAPPSSQCWVDGPPDGIDVPDWP